MLLIAVQDPSMTFETLTFEVESGLSSRSSWGLKRTALGCSQTLSELLHLGVRF